MKKRTAVFCLVGLIVAAVSAQLPTNWVDCTVPLLAGKTQPWPGGISGARCNRLNGDLYMDCIGFGIWKSTDKGVTWARVDNNTVSGRLETGWAMDQDQAHPARMAVFSLDGSAGWAPDGVTWKAMTTVGRNWDYGSVDWASTTPKTIFACSHEAGGLLDVSTNGGVNWTVLSVGINPGSALANDAMVGVMDSTTLIYSNGVNGIQRSTNVGSTWSQVSTINPRTRTPTYFNGKHYLGGTGGLLVSTDKGATWHAQGAVVNVCQGPFFGADENAMVIVGTSGVYKSVNAGTSWTKIADMKPNVDGAYQLSMAYYWSTYAWDPINNCIYATAMANHGFRLDLGATAAMAPVVSAEYRSGLSIINGTVYSANLFDRVEQLTLSGKSLFRQEISPNNTIKLPDGITNQPSVVRIKTVQGAVIQRIAQ